MFNFAFAVLSTYTYLHACISFCRCTQERICMWITVYIIYSNIHVDRHWSLPIPHKNANKSETHRSLCIPLGCQRTAIWSKLAPAEAKEIISANHGFSLILWGKPGKNNNTRLSYFSLLSYIRTSSHEKSVSSSNAFQHMLEATTRIKEKVHDCRLPLAVWCIKLSQMDPFHATSSFRIPNW